MHLRERAPSGRGRSRRATIAVAVRALRRRRGSPKHEAGRRSRRTRRTPRRRAARRCGHEHGDHQQRAPAAPSSASDGESANQSTCGFGDHGRASCVDRRVGWSPPNECPQIRFGQAERPSRHATSGTTTASSPSAQVERRVADRRPDVLVQHGRRSARSMYIAASTIATAPITAQTQPCWNTPARIRNSPANVRRERHRERDDADRHQHASRAPGRPRAMPPSSAKLAASRCAARPCRRAGTATSR